MCKWKTAFPKTTQPAVSYRLSCFVLNTIRGIKCGNLSCLKYNYFKSKLIWIDFLPFCQNIN